MDDISWKLIDIYFRDNPNNLVAHHLESYNRFFNSGIHRIFRENNPVRFIEREEKDEKGNAIENRNEILLHLGGKDGSKIYFGKPIIYDDQHAHYMYPNDARLRNMTYGTTIHYDVDVDIIYYIGEERKEETTTLEKIYLGRFPIMLQSNLCILKSLDPSVRFNMGECKYDYGGYFIIDGKEKVIVSQEKFADNMLYVRTYKEGEIYSHSAEIRSVSEDASKPIRTTGVKMISPTPALSNKQIVVSVPNVRKPVPLFILMRALGIVSDKEIIETCLLDLEKNKSYVDLFIPSIHDANKIFNQETAIRFIATFTKRKSINGVLDILMNYFLPHIGEMNFLDKAYFVGTMVKKMLRVYTKEEKPTDRDNFRFKRVEVSGSLIYDLFREYFLIQKRAIGLAMDSEHYFNKGSYRGEKFENLIKNNYHQLFKERNVENGFKKAFKGNWGSETHTKRIGVVQDLNRLSYNTFISHLRKINLPLDASAKVIGPRLLNSSQWGFIDPVDTPDGGNIGLHKHLAISTFITSGSSAKPLIEWIRANTPMKILQECSPSYLANTSKIIINGNWVGVVDNPLNIINLLKMYRRNGILPVFASVCFDYKYNEINIYTDAGRLTRPIFYIENEKISFERPDIIDMINSEKATWSQIISGFISKNAVKDYDIKNNILYEVDELYPSLKSQEMRTKELEKNKAVVEYIDTSEEESSLIAMKADDVKKNKYYTNIEIDSSLIFGVMGNLIIYPEANPYPRDAFSCGQSKQAVSVYHSNHQMRIDKMGVTLNYGQVPLIKSRYLQYINKEALPYGENAIVAIMSYTGYNVEDAILINEGSVKRGLFRTSYYSMYESREESAKVSGTTTNSVFADVSKKNVDGVKAGFDYSHLDKWGLIKENTPLDDKIVLIGKITANVLEPNVYTDASVSPKKGQLGFVDKSFITEGEEGFRVAKVRVREERVPAIGDKMASRAGQKGTIGLIIPEEDMPFCADGTRPDLIINPHAIPSRMTIGQLIESLFGKACTMYGGFGDCTAFATKGSNAKTYGPILTRAGFHSSGNQILYNGMTGEQLQSDIFIGPTYYMRLKHMVKDKINYRARGPNTVLTRQSVQGRANDGGLRIGEMERDAIISHGASQFLNESFLVRGDEYHMAVCNKTGAIAIYNNSKNLFLSPFADGPVKFHTTLDNKMNIENISRFGRSFSILRIPYSLKLLIQELQVMNVQMRIITDQNVDQLISMSYSDNIIELTKNNEDFNVDLNLPEEIDKISGYVKAYSNKMARTTNKRTFDQNKTEQPSGDYNVQSLSPDSLQYPSNSPAYNPGSDEQVQTNSSYNPEEGLQEMFFEPKSPSFSPPEKKADFGSPELNAFFESLPPKSKASILALPDRDQRMVLQMTKERKESIKPEVEKEATEILNIEEIKESEPENETKTDASETKSVSFDTGSETSNSTSSETKKIIL